MLVDQPNERESYILTSLEVILRNAGEMSMRLFSDRGLREVEEKSLGDFVSDADRLVEGHIREDLNNAFPNVLIVGEELGGTAEDTYWIIDPIDGTSNFLSGLPMWCISIALVRDGEPTIGGIIAPALGQMAIGGPTVGLKIDGTFALDTQHSKPSFGVGRNGFWQQQDRLKVEDTIEARGQNVVTLGSCALSLMFVSIGRLSGYREDRCGGFWDCAGGIALCRAANIPAEFQFNKDQSVNVSAGGSVAKFFKG